MIGGTDNVLWVDENAPAFDLIVSAVRQHWPHLVLQNADEDLPIEPSKSSDLTILLGREFFLYRNAAAAENWLNEGVTESNKNTMIHGLLGNRRKPDRRVRSITLVADDWTGELAAILKDIQEAFDNFSKKHLPNGTATPLGPVPHVAERD
jgi:hypothetical protein